MHAWPSLRDHENRPGVEAGEGMAVEGGGGVRQPGPNGMRRRAANTQSTPLSIHDMRWGFMCRCSLFGKP